MKIGIDFHRTIDRYPVLFSKLSRYWHTQGHEIHIITGMQRSGVEPRLNDYTIHFDRFYSIVDFHRENGSEMEWRENGWWMDNALWRRSKGEYCTEARIDVLFDDNLDFAAWLPQHCMFVHVPPAGFEQSCEALFKF
jgi:hypothetical protein